MCYILLNSSSERCVGFNISIQSSIFVLMQRAKITYWVACSGGVDSVVLAHLMKLSGKTFGLLHCNFQLRGEDAQEDEDFVKRLGGELGCEVRVSVFNTQAYMERHRVNVELAARELRYTWFRKIIQEENGVVLLAHHYDDQIETFFLQLRRGGKVRGLAGMPLFKEGFLRPLLKHTKAEIKTIAIQNEWAWREDKTNKSSVYRRNFYRNELLPFLTKNNFPIDEVFALVLDFQQLLGYFNSLKIPQSLSKDEWMDAPEWWQNFILYAHELGNYPPREISKLLEGQKGTYISSENATVWNEGDRLVFLKNARKVAEYELIINEIIDEIPDFTDVHKIYIDGDKVAPPLLVRKWKAGDKFKPVGMNGAKAVGKFLRDRKVPAHQKKNVLVVEDKQKQIVGIFGFGCGETYRISSVTLRPLALTVRIKK